MDALYWPAGISDLLFFADRRLSAYTQLQKIYFKNDYIYGVSEIPFDLAFSHTWLNIHYQNVYWTLLLGLLAIRAMEWLQARLPRQCFALGYVPVAAAAAIAWFIHTDYNAYGVLMIFGFYIFKKQKVALAVYEIILFGFLGQIELFAAFAFIPIFLYNGKKGLSNRWMNIGFYAFYPIHLIVLVLIRYLCG